MITTIIFDLSEVYIKGMMGIEKKIEGKTGIHVESDSFHQTAEAKEFFHGKITEDAFWQKLIANYNLPIDKESLKNLVREQMIEVEGTREIIETLKSNGYKLGLLSIHAKEWINHVEGQFDFHKLFHSVMYSFEVGLSKPDEKAFSLILTKLGVSPDECLFIDDFIGNIEAAAKLGMKTIQFINATQLRQDLKKLQINV